MKIMFSNFFFFKSYGRLRPVRLWDGKDGLAAYGGGKEGVVALDGELPSPCVGNFF